MTALIVLTCVNGLFTVISCWAASRADTHRMSAHLSDASASGHALVAKTSADILSVHSRACGQHPEASGR